MLRICLFRNYIKIAMSEISLEFSRDNQVKHVTVSVKRGFTKARSLQSPSQRFTFSRKRVLPSGERKVLAGADTWTGSGR